MSKPLAHAEICDRIVNECQLAFIYADEEGLIRVWNKGAETMFGYSAAEAIGQSMDIIIPERHRAKHWDGYQRVMQTGVTRYGREVLAVPALRKDGTRISIEFTIALLRSEEGKVLGAAAVVQDVTARWEKDKALRARLASLEAKVNQAEKAQAAREG